MRYGGDYDRGYGRGRMGMGGLRRGPETNWMGRNYRQPGEPVHRGQGRGYDDDAFGRGYRPQHGGWDVEWQGRGYDRGYGMEYDRGYRPLGGMRRGYDDGYRMRGGYDRGYRGMGGMRGRVLNDPWGPYSGFRQAQRRLGAEDRPWPNRYFTDHGHNVGPF